MRTFIASATVLLFTITALGLSGCSRCHEKADPAAQAFLQAHGEPVAQPEQSHADYATFNPLRPQVSLPAGERIGRTSFTIHNVGTQPLAIAKLQPHCRSCRISGEFARRIDPGATVEVPLTIAVGLLESMPSQRFVEVVLMTPDNQALEQLIVIDIQRESAEQER